MKPGSPLLMPLWRVLELPYRAAVAVRNAYYDRPGRSFGTSIPVIAIGNLTVGGTGKTPFTLWLAGRLRARGRTPGIVSRGYGGRAGSGPFVVADARGIHADAEAAGDEPLEIARRLPGLPVVVGSDRVAGATRARELGADLVLLDDGFQHRRLARDLDLVLLDAGEPFGNRHLLPAGPLREPPASLHRADVAVLTRADDPHALRLARAELESLYPQLAVHAARHRPAGFVNARGEARPAPERALAFCGIARPGSFVRAVEAAGARIVETARYADHHVWSAAEIGRLFERARAAGAELVTTEKDLARLARPGMALPDGQPAALRLELEVENEAALLERIVAALSGRP